MSEDPEAQDSPAAGDERPDIGQMLLPVNVGRISGVIVEQIRMLIRQRQLRPGDRLPSERKLCEQFGVSRVMVREALRVLESTGLIQIRVGAHGGAFVTAPTSDRVGEGIADLISLTSMTAADVTEARSVLELGIVPLVCERATEDDIADLLGICERSKLALKRSDYQLDLSAEFHTRVARAAHNPAIEMLAQSFHGPMLMSLQQAKERAPEMGKLGVQEHEDFVLAVQERDSERATGIMGRHLGRTAERVGGKRG